VYEHLPDNTDPGFIELIDIYQHTDIRYPHLKGITLAQWALESGWGLSDLAMRDNNFAGMKWRKQMDPWGRPVLYKDWRDIEDAYVHFCDKAAFIQAYWARFDLISAYGGWQEKAHSPEAFIDFIGPIWVGMSPLHNMKYVNNVKRIYRTRTKPIMKV
jgi:N-acetylmuramoyl-L-alanine amidase